MYTITYCNELGVMAESLQGSERHETTCIWHSLVVDLGWWGFGGTTPSILRL